MPPPPPFPGAPPIGSAPDTGRNSLQHRAGQSNADLGFWSGVGQFFKRCWDDTTGAIGGVTQPGQGRGLFQSDHTLDVFASPVTNPFYFEDPRSLTQFKPIFIWQRTPNANPYFDGGNNFFAGFQGSVAFTPWLSLTVNQIRFDWPTRATTPVGLSNASGVFRSPARAQGHLHSLLQHRHRGRLRPDFRDPGGPPASCKTPARCR